MFALGGIASFVLAWMYVTRPTLASGPSSNRVLNYQLRLTDANGIPLSGTKNVKISFYTAASGGTPVHTDCGTTVTPVARKIVFTNGIGTVLIGDTAASGTTNCADATAPVAIPANLFSNTTLYMGITVDADAEMTPRKRVVAQGYALNADLLDDLDSSSVGGAVAFVPVTDSSGNLVLTQNLTVDGTTLFVDSVNNRIGSGIGAPDSQFDVGGTYSAGTGADYFVTDVNPTVTAGVNNQMVSLLRLRHRGGAGAFTGVRMPLLVSENAGGGQFKVQLFESGLRLGNYTGGPSSVVTPTANLELDGFGSTSATYTMQVENLAGTDIFAIRDDGRVGIGTFSPSSELTVAGSITPAADDTHDLGTSSLRWRDLYLGPTSLHLVSTAGETTTARDWKFSIQETDGASEGNMRLIEGANELVNFTPGGNIGVGDATPENFVDIEAGPLSDGVSALAATATLNASASAQYAAQVAATGSGSAVGSQNAFYSNLATGYTGTSATRAGYFNNANLGGGGTTAISDTGNANYGVSGLSLVTNGGARSAVGVFGYGAQAGNAGATARNFGLLGLADGGGAANSVNLGVYGTSVKTTTEVSVGGMFTLYGETDSIGTLTSAALVADNGATTSPIFLARDNGSTVFSVIDGGNVGIGDVTPAALFTVGTSDAFQVNATGDVTTSGDVALNGGDLTTSAATFNLAASATTLNLVGGSGSTGCTVDGSGNLACTGTISGSGVSLSGHLLPSADDTFDLGSSALRWRDLYLGPTSLHLASTAGETASARDWKIGIDETNGATDGYLRVMEGANQYVTVATNGDFGVGLANPSNPLHVSSTNNDIFRLNNATVSNGQEIRQRFSYGGFTKTFITSRLVDTADDTANTLLIGRLGALDLFTFKMNGNMGVGVASPLARLDLAGNLRTTGMPTAVLTGSIDPAASATVTGVGTLFASQLVVGDRITVSGETRTVMAIASDTSLTVDTAFSDNANDASPDVLYAIATMRDSANTARFAVNDLGNVGIGTAAPAAALNVGSAALFSPLTDVLIAANRSGAGENAFLLAHTDTSGEDAGIIIGTRQVGEDSAIFMDQSDARKLKFATGTTGDDGGRTTNTRMTIDQSGNVGIGDTTPTEGRFVAASSGVVGYFNSTDSSGTVNTVVINNTSGSFGLPVIEFREESTEVGAVIGHNAAEFGLVNGINLTSASGRDIGFRINNSTEAARITTGGRMGIGISSPSSKLHINDASLGSGSGAALVTVGDAITPADLDWSLGGGERALIVNGGPTGGCCSYGDIVLTNSSASPTAGTNIGNVLFAAKSPGTIDTFTGLKAAIDGLLEGSGGAVGGFGGVLTFQTRADNGALTERLRINSAGRVGIGDSTPDHFVDIEAGTLASTIRALTVTGTLSSTAAIQRGATMNFTTSSGATGTYGLEVFLGAGATPSGESIAMLFDNAVAGTGTTPLTTSSIAGNFGVFGSTYGTTTGHNVGMAGFAAFGNVNYGTAGLAFADKASANNVGVVGGAQNAGAGGNRIGGLFYLATAGLAQPSTSVSAALVADNSDIAAPIFLARDNGSTVFSVIDGGNVGIGDSSPAALLTVGNGDKFKVNADGDVTSTFTQLDGTDLANGAGAATTTLILDDTTGFNAGNYVFVNATYAKIVSVDSGTNLTISPALTWADNAVVDEYHVPEIGGVDTSQTLANRYGRGYFIDGIVTGNGTTRFSDNLIDTTGGTLGFNTVNNRPVTFGTGAVTMGGNLIVAGTITSGGSAAFVNGGNSLGAAAILGTNDANSLSFETNNVTYFTIASGGGFTLPVDTDWTLTGGVNGLSFDGTTFSVDATNNRIGIGTTSPISQLHVAGAVPAAHTGTVSTGAATDEAVSISVQGRYAYTVVTTANALKIFDVSNPAAPVQVGSTTTNINNPTSVYVQGRYAYITNFGNSTLQIYDVSNPASPAQVGSVGVTFPHAVYVRGSYAYVAREGSPGRLQIVDVSNPASPVLLGFISTSGTSNPFDLYVMGRYAYVVAHQADNALEVLHVFDVSNPSSPTAVGQVTLNNDLPRSVYVQGRYAYVMGSDFQVIDVSNPAAPSIVGTLVSVGAIGTSVQVQGRYAYAAHISGSTSDIKAIDVSNPAAPTLVGTIPTAQGGTRGVESLFVQGRFLYAVNDADDTLKVYDLGGAYVQQFEAGGIETGMLSIRNNLQALDGDFRGGLTVSDSLRVVSDIGANGGITFTKNGGVASFASATTGNTFTWKIPTDTDGCAAAATEGIIIRDNGGTQRGHICISSTNLLNYYANTFNTSSTDVAETYSTRPEDGIEAGDVVELDPEGGLMVRKTTAASSRGLVGVISTAPGVVLSGIDEATGEADTQNGRNVALKGRVPVKVNLEGGPIAVGDYLTSSSVPGVAMKSFGPGMVIGRALDAYTSGAQGTVRAFVEVGWWNGVEVLGQTDASGIAIADLTVDKNFDLLGYGMLGVKFLEGLGGVWSIDESGKLTVKEVVADQVTVRQTDAKATLDTAKVPSGQDYAQVHNAAINAQTRVFVTFRKNPGSAWWVEEVTEGLFVVKTALPVIEDVAFDYWLVQALDERTPPSAPAEPDPVSESVSGPAPESVPQTPPEAQPEPPPEPASEPTTDSTTEIAPEPQTEPAP